MTTAMTCPVCEAKSVVRNRTVYDDRYGYPGQFTLMRCQDCDHIFLLCHFKPKQLTDLYSNYYPRSTYNLDQHKAHEETRGINAWFDGSRASAFRWVPRNVQVLDIGCGFGETLGYHKARGCDVHGVEADENIRRVAAKFGYHVQVGIFNPMVYEQNAFDYVTMDQVIEHVVDPVQTLRGVAQLLKSGGVAVLSTPNAFGWGARLFGRRWVNWHAPYHLHHFSTRSMGIAAKRAGLLLESTRTITNSEWLHCQWAHLLTFPKSGTPSAFWSYSCNYTLLQKVVIRILKVVHSLKMNHIVTRVFDFFGMGDNHLFLLRKN